MTNAQGKVLYQMYCALYWQVWKIMALFKPFLPFMSLKNVSPWNVMWLYILMHNFASEKEDKEKASKLPSLCPCSNLSVNWCFKSKCDKNVIPWQCSWVSSLQGKLELSGCVMLWSETSCAVIHDVAVLHAFNNLLCHSVNWKVASGKSARQDGVLD